MASIPVVVAPEVRLEYKGVVIFYTYVDDDRDQGRCSYWFTTEQERTNDPFDVRKLKVPARRMLDAHPPFLADDNPEYRVANDAQRAVFRVWWQEWRAPCGVESHAIDSILRQAVDIGLITAFKATGTSADAVQHLLTSEVLCLI